ncbi:hypothetical protein [Elioraea sp.]|uniref:hypothetical protein n=1 Tax=Elioraea sp. TaxID=2185103 RepID=UPI003F6F4C63
MAAENARSSSTKRMRSERLPGRKPGPAQREEFLRIWDAVDDNGRKMLLFIARGILREQGLVPAPTPLVLTDRVL